MLMSLLNHRQIACSDAILLNKVEDSTPEDLDNLTSRIESVPRPRSLFRLPLKVYSLSLDLLVIASGRSTQPPRSTERPAPASPLSPLSSTSKPTLQTQTKLLPSLPSLNPTYIPIRTPTPIPIPIPAHPAPRRPTLLHNPSLQPHPP
jgi:hypothetical protein